MSESTASVNVMVEVEYLEVGGDTCERCAGTREFARDAVDGMRAFYSGTDVDIKLVERTLDPSGIEHSNRVLVNGRLAEEWLGGTSGESDCPSCADLIGESACCRTIVIDGVTSESVTREVIAGAIRAAVEAQR